MPKMYAQVVDYVQRIVQKRISLWKTIALNGSDTVLNAFRAFTDVRRGLFSLEILLKIWDGIITVRLNLFDNIQSFLPSGSRRLRYW